MRALPTEPICNDATPIPDPAFTRIRARVEGTALASAVLGRS